MHSTPQSGDCNWKRLSVPEKVHDGIIQINQWNKKRAASPRGLIENHYKCLATSGTTSQSKLVPINKSRLLFKSNRFKGIIFELPKNALCNASGSREFNLWSDDLLHHLIMWILCTVILQVYTYINKLVETEFPEIFKLFTFLSRNNC